MLSSLYAYDLSHVVNFYDTYLIISKTVYRGRDKPLKESVFYPKILVKFKKLLKSIVKIKLNWAICELIVFKTVAVSSHLWRHTTILIYIRGQESFKVRKSFTVL